MKYKFLKALMSRKCGRNYEIPKIDYPLWQEFFEITDSKEGAIVPRLLIL